MPYFDHNATTPLLGVAREAWLRASDEAWANPSSPYRSSARAHRLLDEARERVGALLGVGPGEIVFTSGATEANNAVIRWVARMLGDGQRALVAATEHPSVGVPARDVLGGRLEGAAVDRCGTVDLSALERGGVGFVAVMAANNETGVVAPVAAVDAQCMACGAWYLCDASQWVGRMPTIGMAPGAFIVGCAHKFGGPKGVGFLRVPPAAQAAGFRGQLGGAQEDGRRAGTENLPAVAAMVAAWEQAEGNLATIAEREKLRVGFLETLGKVVPGVKINAEAPPGLWNTLSLRMPAHENTRWVVRLDRLGCEVSTGSACASGSEAPSHVLSAMGLGAAAARRTVRVSAGWETTAADWQTLAAAFGRVWASLESEVGGAIRL